jgi:hypothetical protein
MAETSKERTYSPEETGQRLKRDLPHWQFEETDGSVAPIRPMAGRAR